MEVGKTLLITQARTGSTRLPDKVLLRIEGNELLKIHLERLNRCKEINDIVVATTISDDDVRIVNLCKSWGFNVFRGQVNDVLDRYYNAAKEFSPQWVVRVTSDCPLIDPNLVDAVIKAAKVNNVDYASNILVEHFPDGQDIEVFKFSSLERAWKKAVLKSDREHVTLYIRNNCTFNNGNEFSSINFPCFDDFSKVRITVDEISDFELVTKLITTLGAEQDWLTYTKYILENGLDNINGDVIRNEGLIKSLKEN